MNGSYLPTIHGRSVATFGRVVPLADATAIHRLVTDPFRSVTSGRNRARQSL